MQVLALFLEVILGAILKLDQKAHDLSLRVDALVRQHVKFLLLRHEHPERQALFLLDHKF